MSLVSYGISTYRDCIRTLEKRVSKGAFSLINYFLLLLLHIDVFEFKDQQEPIWLDQLIF